MPITFLSVTYIFCVYQIQMSLFVAFRNVAAVEVGRRAARSPGVAQRPTCVAITEGDRRSPCPCLPCSRKYPIRGRTPAKCSCYSKRHYQGTLWLPWTSICY